MQVSISAFGSTGDIPQEHQPFFIREELGTLIKQKMTEDNSSTKKKKKIIIEKADQPQVLPTA